MTRETKIGLLVGLAFIIVVGILLSDHFHGAMELPPAALDRAGPNVLQAVNTLGSGQAPPPTVALPDEVSPRMPMPTPHDLEPKPMPVVLSDGNSGGAPVTPGSVDPALDNAARQRGEELVPVNPDGSPITPSPLPGPVAQTPANPVESGRQYTAQPGDSVSKMAARLMGANTKANRAAIIAANASLQQDADRVIAGETYVIPTASSVAAGKPAAPAAVMPTAPTVSTDNSGGESDGGAVYTVQPGDNLWRIAISQVGDSGAVAAIQELNRDTLGGGTTLKPGMKLRLPAKRVALAN
jgi:Tfp pilus assembly protein FimV